MQTVFQKQFAA